VTKSKNRCFPVVVYIGGKAYRPSKYLFHFSASVEKDSGNSSLSFVIRRYADPTTKYLFPEDVLRPLALAQEIPEERFIMPRIIEELRGKNDERLLYVYMSALLAASLGLIDLVHEYTDLAIKERDRIRSYGDPES